MIERDGFIWTLGQIVELACILEASAPKAGNVHPGAEFADMTFADFVASAVAVAPVFDAATDRGVGATVLSAVERRRAVVHANTNLGIVLLLAPLAAVDRDTSLVKGIGPVLERLTVADARAVYQAIRHSRAGGLGRTDTQDVAEEPTCTLREAMRFAADRDLIARQYVTDFADVLNEGVDLLRAATRTSSTLLDAIVHTHLEILVRHPDTLIARKLGITAAREVSQRAAAVLKAGFPAERGRSSFKNFDTWLREPGSGRNPGATADLVTASLFAAIRDAIIPLSMSASSPSGSAGEGI